MKSRLLFRESGYPIRVGARFDWAWLLAGALLVAVAAATAWWMERGEPAALQRGYQAGQADTLAQLHPLLQSAYQQGVGSGATQCNRQGSGTALQVRP